MQSRQCFTFDSAAVKECDLAFNHCLKTPKRINKQQTQSYHIIGRLQPKLVNDQHHLLASANRSWQCSVACTTWLPTLRSGCQQEIA